MKDHRAIQKLCENRHWNIKIVKSKIIPKEVSSIKTTQLKSNYNVELSSYEWVQCISIAGFLQEHFLLKKQKEQEEKARQWNNKGIIKDLKRILLVCEWDT